jgi:hypothetical protein
MGKGEREFWKDNCITARKIAKTCEREEGSAEEKEILLHEDAQHSNSHDNILLNE